MPEEAPPIVLVTNPNTHECIWINNRPCAVCGTSIEVGLLIYIIKKLEKMKTAQQNKEDKPCE